MIAFFNKNGLVSQSKKKDDTYCSSKQAKEVINLMQNMKKGVYVSSKKMIDT